VESTLQVAPNNGRLVEPSTKVRLGKDRLPTEPFPSRTTRWPPGSKAEGRVKDSKLGEGGGEEAS
jgi:hypothetical protein